MFLADSELAMVLIVVKLMVFLVPDSSVSSGGSDAMIMVGTT
jgi:hypothetical protein